MLTFTSLLRDVTL